MLKWSRLCAALLLLTAIRSDAPLEAATDGNYARKGLTMAAPGDCGIPIPATCEARFDRLAGSMERLEVKVTGIEKDYDTLSARVWSVKATLSFVIGGATVGGILGGIFGAFVVAWIQSR